MARPRPASDDGDDDDDDDRKVGMVDKDVDGDNSRLGRQRLEAETEPSFVQKRRKASSDSDSESFEFETTVGGAQMEIELPPIFVCCPSWGKISTSTAVNLFSLISLGSKVRLYLPERMFPSSATFNQCVRKMLIDEEVQGNHWEYIFFIDGDVATLRLSLPEALARLVRYDKDIVSAATPTWRKSPDGHVYPLPTAGVRAPDDPTGLSFLFKAQQGLQRVDVVGLAFTLIKRRVLEELSPAPFRYRWLDEWEIDRMTPDYDFCLRAQERGFEVWCDYNLKVSHYKDADLLWVEESITAYLNQIEDQILQAIREKGLKGYKKGRLKFQLH